jgi:hypothetical protein
MISATRVGNRIGITAGQSKGQVVSAVSNIIFLFYVLCRCFLLHFAFRRIHRLERGLAETTARWHIVQKQSPSVNAGLFFSHQNIMSNSSTQVEPEEEFQEVEIATVDHGIEQKTSDERKSTIDSSAQPMDNLLQACADVLKETLDDITK